MLEVRRLRQARGWKQSELAFHADLAPSVVSQIETGKRDPSASTLRKLAGALECDVADLFPKAQAPLPFEGAAHPDLERILDMTKEEFADYAEGLDNVESRELNDALYGHRRHWDSVLWMEKATAGRGTREAYEQLDRSIERGFILDLISMVKAGRDEEAAARARKRLEALVNAA